MSVTGLSFISKHDRYIVNRTDENMKSSGGNENPSNDVKMTPKYILSTLPKKHFQKILFFVLVLTCIVALVTYLYSRPDTNKICDTPLCHHSAENLLSAMNQSVDPCQDFYTFACGNWGRNRTFPKHLLNIDWTASKQDQLLRNLSNFLSQNNTDDEPKPIHKTRLFYKSCLSAHKNESDDFGAVKNVLNRIKLSPMPPILQQTKNFSWVEVAVLSKQTFNQDFFVAFSIANDPLNCTHNKIHISKPSGLPPLPVHQQHQQVLEEYRNRNGVKNDRNISEPYKRAFVQYVSNVTRFVLKNSGIDITREEETAFNETVGQLLEFHVSMFELVNNYYRAAKRIPTYIAVDELQNITDTISSDYNITSIINWRQYFQLMFKNVKNVTLNFDGKDSIILISDLDYITGVLRLLADSSPHLIEFYMWFKTVSTIGPYSNNQLREYHNKFVYGLIKVDKIPRELYCADVVNQLMGMATAYPSVNDEAVTGNMFKIAEMVDNIQFAFQENMKTISWMDEASRSAALRKIKTMKKYIGFPKWLPQKEVLEEYYADVNVTENFLQNILSETQRQNGLLLSIYGQVSDPNQEVWVTNPMTVNAFNYMGGNTINIPAGYMTFPFYHQGIEALNYAAMGSTIGHEMTHSFDNTGKEYDDKGNANPWWTDETLGEFQNRAECFVNYYDTLKDPQGIPLKVNGRRTLDENIADNGGLRNAFLAYVSYVRKYGEEPSLPNFEKYTAEQLFFLGFANTWCEASKNLMLATIGDGHSPNNARVWGVLANSKEFARVWKCPRGSRMNSCMDKCEIW